MEKMTMQEMIRDTQLSRYENVTYHCGLDMLNNHILRSQTFKTVTLPPPTVFLLFPMPAPFIPP